MKKLFLIISGLVGIVLVVFFAASLSQRTPQSKSIPSVDALLLHGYWLSQKDSGPVTLSLRGELEVKAAYLLYQHNKTEYVIVPAGPIWGSKYPSLGEFMAQRLMQLGIPSNKIILDPTAMDTYEEVSVGVKNAQQHHFGSLGDLAASQHIPVIKQLFKVQHASADFFSYEDVINTYGSLEDKQAIKMLTASLYSLGFDIYELAVRIVLLIDPHYRLLTNHAYATRTHKGPYGGVPLLPIDKYEL